MKHRRKYRPAQCPSCLNFRQARDEQDPSLKGIAPWTKNRCGVDWQYWWQFDAEKELIGTTNNLCKDFKANILKQKLEDLSKVVK